MEKSEEQDLGWRRQNIWLVDPNRIIAGMSIVGQWEKRFESILEYIQKPDDRPDFQDVMLLDNPHCLTQYRSLTQ